MTDALGVTWLHHGLAPALLAAPVLFAGLAAIEGWYLQRSGRRYDWKAFLASLGDALGRQFVNRLLGFGLAGALFVLAARYRLADMPMDNAGSWVLLLITQDFCYYWLHRADHRIRWLWATHSVHHSSNDFNLGAAYRLGWTQRLGGGAVFFLPLVLLGFPPLAVLLAVVLNLSYQYWLHTGVAVRLGPLEYVLNTPAHHRVHHARNACYLDSNFGGILIVFDRLFGTYAEEQPEAPCEFGLVEPLRSYNPLRIAFHGWLGLLRDLRKARSLRAAAVTLFGPPR